MTDDTAIRETIPGLLLMPWGLNQIRLKFSIHFMKAQR